jgi:hypothetical protein
MIGTFPRDTHFQNSFMGKAPMAVFTNQVAVGIGKAIAFGLAAQGTQLCLLGRKIETLETVAKIARLKASRVVSAIPSHSYIQLASYGRSY